jgi:outer membrane protein assembly factor BamB
MTILLLLIGGCGHKYHLSDEYVAQGGSAGLQEARFDGKLDVLWEADFNGKPSGPLSIHRGVLAIPSAKRRIEFRATASGENLGRVKMKGMAHTGLVYFADSLAVFAVDPPRGRVVCWDLTRHDEVWRFRVADVVGVALTEDGGVLVAARSGELTLLDMETGEAVWNYECESRLSTPPAVVAGTAFVGSDDRHVLAIDLQMGQTDWTSPELETPAIGLAVNATRQMVWVAGSNGAVNVLRLDDGDWGVAPNLPPGRWSIPVLAGDKYIVASTRGEVVALDSYSLEEVWRYDTEQAIKAAPTVVNGVVLVATLRGKLFSLNSANGEIIDQRELGSAISQSPVTDGTHVFVATHGGAIVCLGALVP